MRRKGVGERLIGRVERQSIDVAQSRICEAQPGHGADRHQHHPAVRRGAVAAQLYEDRETDEFEFNWRQPFPFEEFENFKSKLKSERI